MTRTIFALIAALLPTLTAAWGAELPAGRMQMVISDATGGVSLHGQLPGEQPAELRWWLYDGREEHALEPTPFPPVRAGAALTQALGVAGLPLELAVRYETRGELLLATISARNTGAEQQWLEVGPEVLLGATTLSVFDGRDRAETPQEEFGSDEFMGWLPFIAAWDRSASFGVGMAASELRSWFGRRYLPAEGRGSLRSVTRLVLDPGQEDRVTFFLSARPADWEQFEILQAYYESAPERFRPAEGVDERITRLGGAQYRAWSGDSEFAGEISRRLMGGWDWAYAPFRRTGDIYGRRELWDYEPVRPMSAERAQSWEEFHRWRRERFARGEWMNVALLFYVPSQVWCEERLATGPYADALVEDPEVRTIFVTPWVTGHDNERLVFPYETGFGERSREDMRMVAEELGLRGFAFDTAEGAGKYRGPALPRVEGRAWDENGVYCRNSVAIAKLMQFVHTLRTADGATLGLVGNIHPGGSYSSPLYSDAIMLEGEPWKVNRDYPNQLRYLCGPKTIVWWEGYGLDSFIDLAKARPEQVRMALRGLADYTLLASLRLGIIPPPGYTQGVERLVQWLPAITECAAAGWRPITAVRVPEPLWASRYGDGLGSLVAIAHETGETVAGEAVVENARLGEGALLWCDYDGAERVNRIADGQTRLELRVPTRTPVLLRAWARVEPAAAVRSARVSADQGSAASDLRITLRGQGEVTVRFHVPEGMQLARLTGPGDAIERSAREQNAVRVRLDREATITVHLRSSVILTDDEALLGFPFIDEDGAARCTITVPADATQGTRHAAQAVQTYFRYWNSVQGRPDVKPIPLIEGEEPGGPVVRVALERGSDPRISLEGETLEVSAGNERELWRTVYALLGALDRKYWTPVPGAAYSRQAELSDGILHWDETP